jgi:hypothetical protein
MESKENHQKPINKLEKFESMENFINSKKEQILTLRKKKNRKNNLYRILLEKEIKEQDKYKILEFDLNDFSQAKKNL